MSKRPQDCKQLYFYPDQKFSCINCGRCCTKWEVPITAKEKASIEELQIPGVDFSQNIYFTRYRNKSFFIINKKADSQCIFIDSDNLCLIHKYHGEQAKPLACRLYPFEIINWKDGKSSGCLRFDCPAVVQGKGKEMSQHLQAMKSFAKELEKADYKSKAVYRPELEFELSSLRQLAEAFQNTLLCDDFEAGNRIFAGIRILEFFATDSNYTDITDNEIDLSADILDLVERSQDELKYAIDISEAMNLDSHITFRYLLSGYVRSDEEALSRFLPIGRVKRAWKILKFVLAKGSLNELSSNCPDTTNIDPIVAMEQVKYQSGCMDRYWDFLGSKLTSMHFCGNLIHHLSFEEGMRHLLLTYPVCRAFAALYALADNRTEVVPSDVENALMIIDHTFGRSRFFALKHVKKVTRKLCRWNVFAYLLKLSEGQKE
jgi:lysine-N-methylase